MNANRRKKGQQESSPADLCRQGSKFCQSPASVPPISRQWYLAFLLLLLSLCVRTFSFSLSKPSSFLAEYGRDWTLQLAAICSCFTLVGLFSERRRSFSFAFHGVFRDVFHFAASDGVWLERRAKRSVHIRLYIIIIDAAFSALIFFWIRTIERERQV